MNRSTPASLNDDDDVVPTQRSCLKHKARVNLLEDDDQEYLYARTHNVGVVIEKLPHSSLPTPIYSNSESTSSSSVSSDYSPSSASSIKSIYSSGGTITPPSPQPVQPITKKRPIHSSSEEDDGDVWIEKMRKISPCASPLEFEEPYFIEDKESTPTESEEERESEDEIMKEALKQKQITLGELEQPKCSYSSEKEEVDEETVEDIVTKKDNKDSSSVSSSKDDDEVVCKNQKHFVLPSSDEENVETASDDEDTSDSSGSSSE